MPEMCVAGKLWKAGKRAFTKRGHRSAFSLTTPPDPAGQTRVHVRSSEKRDKTTQSADLFHLEPRKKITHCNLRACSWVILACNITQIVYH